MILMQFVNLVGISLLFALGLFIWLRMIGAVHGIKDLASGTKKKLWLISLIVVTVSPFVLPTAIGKSENLKVLRFGAPNRYVEQHIISPQNIVDESEKVTLLNRWKSGIMRYLRFRVDLYLASIVEVYLILYGVLIISGDTR